MPLGVLQHFTIEPADLERTKHFYVDVLGFTLRQPPPTGVPGDWRHLGGRRKPTARPSKWT